MTVPTVCTFCGYASDSADEAAERLPLGFRLMPASGEMTGVSRFVSSVVDSMLGSLWLSGASARGGVLTSASRIGCAV